jgi:hypothetical protein
VIKKALLLASVVLAGGVGLARAQDAVLVHGDQPDHPKIFELKERIQSQRDRITQALKDNTISEKHAQDCRNVLDGVENDIKAESAANGPHRFMRMDRFVAYNGRLDVNSAFLQEQKQTYYYYGQYYNEHDYGY